MYDQIRADTLYVMLYAGAATMAMLSACYLLLRRGNAFVAEITPPLHLRRCTAAFFASLALNHVWYMPLFFLQSSREARMVDLVGGLLDCMTIFPLALIVLLAMLQDRHRPLWPVFALMTPIVVEAALGVATGSYALMTVEYVYCLVMCVGLTIYMVRALRQYGHWLRNNYADLEHKEVWQSFMVLAIMLLVFGIYAFTIKGPVYQYAMQAILFVLIGYLLWRVETLSDLSLHLATGEAETDDGKSAAAEDKGLSQATLESIGQLLQQYCIDTQLYLQHDLTISQLAKAVGTNRNYLSQYFAGQGIAYNAYINNLRINRFMRLYREAVAAQRPFTAQQLASESGYRSYSTFSIAFKQRMGQTVTAWMRDTDRGT